MNAQTSFQLCVVTAALTLLPAAAHAAAIYNFSFDETLGGITGVVSGTLDLSFLTPGGSGSGSADSLVLTSIPSGYGSLAGGDTATNWAYQVENNFTVVDGTVTSFEFFSLTSASDPSDLLCLNSTSDHPSFWKFHVPPGERVAHQLRCFRI